MYSFPTSHGRASPALSTLPYAMWLGHYADTLTGVPTNLNST